MKKYLLLTGITFFLFLKENKSQNSLTPIDSAMIVCFPFSGNANDMSGNNHNGTINGAVLTADRFSNPNSAFSFNGANQNISVPNFGNYINGNEVSISFWSTSTVNLTRSAFIFVSDVPSNRFNVHVYYVGGTYWDYGNISSNGRLFWSNSTLPPTNTWDHWVFVTSQIGNYQKCYKNGVLQLNKVGSSTFTNSPVKDLLIGGGVGFNNANLWFDGKLDDIRIYNRALTQNDVTNLYSNNLACITCPAVSTPTNNTDFVNQSICLGKSTSLTVISSPTVNWYSSANSTISLGSGTTFVTPTYTAAGTYTFYAKAVSSCSASNAEAITFTVNPAPNIQVTSSKSVICFGQTTNLQASGGISYTWNPGNLNGNSIIVSPGSNTTYTVTGTDINGCTNTTYYTIFVSSCDGIATVNRTEISFKIYPNPSKDDVSIQLITLKDIDTHIEVIDMRGAVVQTLNLTFNRDKTIQQIPIKDLSKGLYYIKVSSMGNETRFVKLIKE